MSNAGIGVPGPEDHYNNPPTVSFLPSVRSSSQSYSIPLLSIPLILITGLSLLFVEPDDNSCTNSKEGKRTGTWGEGHFGLPSRLCGRDQSRSSCRRQLGLGMAHLLLCPFLTFPTHSIIPPPFPRSLQWPNHFLIAIFFNT